MTTHNDQAYSPDQRTADDEDGANGKECIDQDFVSYALDKRHYCYVKWRPLSVMLLFAALFWTGG